MVNTKENKAMNGAQRLKRSNDKKKDAGLMQIKVWVADQRNIDLDGVKSEAYRVREYAAKQPNTKAVLATL